MVERSVEPEVKKVFEAMKEGRNFILEGGAGSGKTYSLISIIEKLSKDEPDKSIACITYTNNAVAEIRERINNDKLWVSTIHEFIWKVIGRFQKEIKDCLVELINDDSQKLFIKSTEIFDQELVSIDYFNDVRVTYNERYSMSIDSDNRVKISHDHILILAEKMFSRYGKLCDILIDTANYVFVDEYQDTNPLVVKILLEHLQNRNKKNIIGFFGDSMQAIYDSGVGNLSNYSLEKIQKAQNRRNPQKVITLANKFRNDGLIQTASDDLDAPNMDNGNIIQGTVKFIYGDGIEQLNILRNSQLYNQLEFNNQSKTKELRLTHKLNSEIAGFYELFELYKNDLFVKLVKSLKDKVKKGNIDYDGKLFGELVEESQIKIKGGGLLADEIQSESKYSSFYDEIKYHSYEEVIKKVWINNESLFSYSFNGLKGQYEPKTDRDRILRKLDFIYELLNLYSGNQINNFLNLTSYKIDSLSDKMALSKIMTKISSEVITIGEVLDIVTKNHLILKDDLFDDFIENSGYYLWSRIKMIPFKEYVNSIAYLREYVSVITQHKVKGSEYENVLVLLDNGNWSKYNFATLFGQGSGNENIQNRTKKLFYVAITRAKKNLIVYMPSNDKKIIHKARDFFEPSDIIDVTSL
ncbi:ATP-dependent helicase [Ligilactobacillus murinus]|uniref:ATP-dependent helicase n=1 Tax=Ligilactobacillus murinus TaxID=1622 RepID=UPI00296B2769|nr:ATP-dependent helicase [Ligilactobacillus murinus]WOY89000.1 ATP-dependent helicase [Ligilactobacillus murinus]